MRDDDYRSISLWHDTTPGALTPRPPLDTEEAVDVAIVGAGYTGLWTAYYLTELEPALRVAIIEAEIAGFGASGRNGGWVVGTLAGMDSRLANPGQREGGIALQRAMFDSVDEIGRVCEQESIDCHFAKGGNITVATEEAHRELLLEDREPLARALGFGDEDVQLARAGRLRRAYLAVQQLRRPLSGALCGNPPGAARAGSGRGGRGARRDDLRALARDCPRIWLRRDEERPATCPDRGARDRGRRRGGVRAAGPSR